MFLWGVVVAVLWVLLTVGAFCGFSFACWLLLTAIRLPVDFCGLFGYVPFTIVSLVPLGAAFAAVSLVWYCLVFVVVRLLAAFRALVVVGFLWVLICVVVVDFLCLASGSYGST